MKHILVYLFMFAMLAVSLPLLNAETKRQNAKAQPTAAVKPAGKNAASASQVGITLNASGVYLQFTNQGSEKTGGTTEVVTNSAHLGGFSLGLTYRMLKSLELYVSMNAAFGAPFTHTLTTKFRTETEYRRDSSAVTTKANFAYAVDSQIGLLYVFQPTKSLELKLGGGLGIGGAGLTRKGMLAGQETKDRYGVFLIGAGLHFDAVYLLTRNFGLHAGVANTFYAVPVLTLQRSTKLQSNKETLTKTSEIFQRSVGSFSNVFTMQCGMTFSF